MNKLFILFSILLGAISLQVNAVQSGNCLPSNDEADCGKPTSYILTMKKLELCTGAPNTDIYDVTCTGAVTVGTGSLVFDVMSVTAGKMIASFASTTGLPIGTTFTHIKPTLSREIKIQGSATVTGDFDDFTCYTDSTATLNGANKYERLLAGKTSGTATLTSYYVNSDSGTNDDGTSQNAANKMKMCTNKACTTTYDWTSYIKDIPSSDYRYGISIEDVTNAEDDFSVLYKLQTPYTVSEIAPKIDIAFGGSVALNVITSNGSTCAISPYYVKTEFSITD